MSNLLQKAIEKRDVKALSKAWFDVDLTGKQIEIVRAIAYKEHKRLVISAYTRYGKSFSVAVGILLYIIFNKDKKINLIAPISDQTSILRNYAAEFIMRCPELVAMLPFSLKGAEKIKREVSRKRITFTNGCELRIFSAEGEATRLMGWGGDLIVMDESCLIEGEVYRQKIARMLGDSPDSMLVEIGNPWHMNNQMYEHWIDPDFHKIHIPWQTGIKEERIREEFIEEQRRDLTPMEFTILYEANFPAEAEDQLISKEWIDEAVNKGLELESQRKIAGLDVAEFGRDWSVLTIGLTDGERYVCIDIRAWAKCHPMDTVQKTTEYVDKETEIYVDATGVGSGVPPRLKELGYKSYDFKGGRSPEEQHRRHKEERERFSNQRAQYYWRLRLLFQNGLIAIPDNKILRKELMSIRYEIPDTSKKIKIIKPEEKSPDYADSLMLMCCDQKKDIIFAFA